MYIYPHVFSSFPHLNPPSMASFTPFLIFFFFLLFPTFSSPQTLNHRFTKIYAFGDSFTDTGNTHSTTAPFAFGHVSSPPYGTTFFHRPTNRYSDGRLVIDFLSAALSLPFLPPYLRSGNVFSPHGVNFAVAGSTALDHHVFVNHNITLDITPQSLGTQLRWFEGYLAHGGCRGAGSPQCAAAVAGALFWVGEIGVNDYAYGYGSSMSPEFIRREATQNLVNFLQELLNKGVKNIVVQGLPLIGCLPASIYETPYTDRDEYGCSSSLNKIVYLHNSVLQAKLQELRRRHPAAIISYADYSAAHLAVIKNPKVSGFTEPFKVCCGAGGGRYNFDIFNTCGSPGATRACSEPSKYVNWDGVHLTEAMYQKMADLFFHGGYCIPSFLGRNSSN